jgi:hypothetical protein
MHRQRFPPFSKKIRLNLLHIKAKRRQMSWKILEEDAQTVGIDFVSKYFNGLASLPHYHRAAAARKHCCDRPTQHGFYLTRAASSMAAARPTHFAICHSPITTPPLGNALGGSNTNAVPVSNGLFSVTLDFGSVFDGSMRSNNRKC